MNPFRKRPKTPDSGTVSPSHNQPATSLSVPDRRGPLKRARSWVGGLLHPREQPLEIGALALSTPASTSTLPTGPANFVSNPTLSPPANLGIPVTSSSSVFGPPSTITPSQDDPSLVPGPVLDPVPNEVTPEATPVIEKDPLKKTAWITFRETLKILEKVASAVPFVHFGEVIGGLNAVLEKFDEADGNREDIETITRHIKRIQTIVEPLKLGSMDDVPRVTDSLTATIGNLERELASLTSTAKNRQEQSKLKQVVGSSNDASVIKHLNQNFDRALHAFQTETVLDIANRLETQAQDELIKSLPRADNAGWNSGLRSLSGVTTCLEQTQEATLGLIEAWSDGINEESQPIFWVWGMAGTGKTTISQTVARRENQKRRLGASFFFSRDTQEQSDPLLLIPTLAYQLSSFDSVYKAHLAKGLKAKPDVGRGTIEDQLTSLLVDPLSACKSISAPIVIVIDALDECEPESAWKVVIRTLGDHIPRIRQKVKILATSRPEDKLHSEFRSSTLDTHAKSWKLHEISEQIVSGDIARYIDHHLQRIAFDHKLPKTWPEEAQRDILVKKAGTLFIVAATLIKFIDDDTSGPMAELNALTKDDVIGALGHGDALIDTYTTIINLALRPKTSSKNSDKASRISDLIHTVIGTIILVKDPMTTDTLTAFLQGLNVSGALSHLHSLLIVPATSEAPIRVLHQSFPQYLTNLKQSDSRLYIDPAAGNARLATLCLTHLQSLGRNPYKIDDPGHPHSYIDNPEGRIDVYIPLHIQYSCLHVTEHLTAASHLNNEQLSATIATFCKSRLLVWIEVLSYLGRLDMALKGLQALQVWCVGNSDSSNQIDQIIDNALQLLAKLVDTIHKGGDEDNLCLTRLPWAPPCVLWSHSETPELRLPWHPTSDYTFDNLVANCLSFHYIKTAQVIYLDAAIHLHREALQLRPPGHSTRDSTLNNLALCIRHRYHRTRNASDLAEAILLSQEVLEIRSPRHPGRDWALNNLALCLQDRHQQSGQVCDLAEAISLNEEALELRPTGHPQRASSITALAVSRSLSQDRSVPQCCGRRVVSEPRGVVLAIKSGDIAKAVSLLEQERISLFHKYGRHCTAVDVVREVSPDLATRFLSLSAELDVGAVAGSFRENTAPNGRLYDEWVGTVEEIRHLPGLDSFLLPSPFHRLQQAAKNGPVVIININKDRSDAIIVLASGDPLLVPLPEAFPLMIQRLVQRLGTRPAEWDETVVVDILRTIWQVIVSPVVARLCSAPIQLPLRSRIWWFPVGAASMLPLHAAGPYKGGEANLGNIFVSSYTPTMGALIHAQTRVADSATQVPMRSVLVVGQADTPGERPLRNVTKEIKAIRNIIPSSALILQSSEGTKEAVLHGIRECKWLHLACHGHRHSTQPFKSHFSMHDGPISLLDLMSKDLPQAELAVLSTCHSARGSNVLPDESQLPAAGMLIAGFKSVLGTMWAFEDGLGSPLSEEFYKIMLDGKKDYTDAAVALAKAFHMVRKKDKSAVSFMQSINVVHYGV